MQLIALLGAHLLFAINGTHDCQPLDRSVIHRYISRGFLLTTNAEAAHMSLGFFIIGSSGARILAPAPIRIRFASWRCCSDDRPTGFS
jgi:hypothetical protein